MAMAMACNISIVYVWIWQKNRRTDDKLLVVVALIEVSMNQQKVQYDFVVVWEAVAKCINKDELFPVYFAWVRWIHVNTTRQSVGHTDVDLIERFVDIILKAMHTL